MNKSKKTHFTIKVYANRQTKDELVKHGAILLRTIGKNKSKRYSMVTDNIDIIPNDALVMVNREQWEGHAKFAEILVPSKAYNDASMKDWHYEYLKGDIAQISGKAFKEV